MEPGGCRAGRRRKLEGKGSQSIKNFSFFIQQFKIQKFSTSKSV